MSASVVDDAVFAALIAKTDALRLMLLAKVDANLSGGILQSRSGALRASIRSDLEAGDGSVTVVMESIGVPYAAIQEYGGRTGAHTILATKAKALRFVGVGGIAFAKSIRHPGSTIPARTYLGSALEAMRAEITSGLKTAVLDALAEKGVGP